MTLAIKIIGVVIVLVAILYVLKPGVMKWLIEFFKRGKRIYLVGLIRFALAIVFLLGAHKCNIRWVIVTFGILFLASGLSIFMVGHKRIASILGWYQKRSELLLRLFALIVLAIGAVIIYSA